MPVLLLRRERAKSVARTSFLRDRLLDRRVWLIVGSAILLIVCALFWNSYRTSPVRVAERFITANRDGDYASIESTLDDSFRMRVPVEHRRKVLETLHPLVPSQLVVKDSGRPSFAGIVSDWKTFVVVVQREKAGSSNHAAGEAIILTEQKGEWKVSFAKTYQALAAQSDSQGTASAIGDYLTQILGRERASALLQ